MILICGGLEKERKSGEKVFLRPLVIPPHFAEYAKSARPALNPGHSSGQL